jgi:hypothetical protein
MKAYAILGDTITLYETPAEARQAVAAAPDVIPALVITSEAELANSPLSMGQLVDIWNGFAGVVPFDDLKPVRKFTDRKTAVARMWRAIQRLAPVATEAAPSGAQGVQDAPKKARSAKDATAREGTKKARIIALLRAPEGATLAEIQTLTGWQPHSIRGFLSGTLGKKMGLTVESFKTPEGARAYRVATK